MTFAYLVAGLLIGWFAHPADQENPLIDQYCVALTPPEDNTFGATTLALKDCVLTYRKCQTACKAE